MPPKYVKTVRQLIYWEYSKLIAKAAGFDNQYGFIVSQYKKFNSDVMKWSSSIHDHEKELDQGRKCTYCGSVNNLTMDHIIPTSHAGVDPRIIKLLDSSDNCICACRNCNSSKGSKDIFEWYGKDKSNDIPNLALSKFLKLAYQLHETQGTLDLCDPNMDGVLDIYDLGVVITNIISRISQNKSSL
jgi:hypothetical protein